jgi:hypothetical protein
MKQAAPVEPSNYFIERRHDGALIVRVRATTPCDPPLPDAVFTFRPADPQFEVWQRRYREQVRRG